MVRQKDIYKKSRGIGAVEMLVGISILAIMFIAISFTVMRFINTGKDVADKTQALCLAEETLEMVRFIRDEKWNHIQSLTDGTIYYLDVTGTDIATSTTPEIIDIYTRSFTIDSVERDGSDDIVTSGAQDNTSKYVTATVTWGSPAKSVSLMTILADINNP